MGNLPRKLFPPGVHQEKITAETRSREFVHQENLTAETRSREFVHQENLPRKLFHENSCPKKITAEI